MAEYSAGDVVWRGRFDGKGIERALERTRKGVEATAKGIEKGLNQALSRGASRAEKSVAKSYGKTTSEIAKIKAEIEKLKETGGDWRLTKEAQKLDNELGRLSRTEATLKEQIRSLENEGHGFGKGYQKLNEQLSGIQAKIREVEKEYDSLGEGERSEKSPKLNTLEKQLERLQDKARETEQQLQQIGEGKNVTVGGVIKKLRSAFEGIKKTASEAGKTAQKSAGGALKSFIKWGLGIRSIFFAYRKLRKAVGEGFSNLLNVDPEAKRQMDNLKASVLMLKNAFGAMVAPIFKTVEPALSSLANKVADVANSIGQFLGALTGKGFAVAKKTFSGIDTGASGASDSVKELKRQLMGFDQINKLDDDSDNSGGGSGSGVDYSSMFETYEKAQSSFADLVKESWEKSDFTTVGAIISNKLGTALNGVNWDDKKEKISKIAKSFATLLNGFFGEDSLWSGISKTIAGGLNVGISAFDSFVTNIKTKQIGAGITSSIQDAFNQVEWGNLGHAFGESLKKIFDFGSGLLQGVDWQRLPSDIWNAVMSAVRNVNWGGVASSISELLGSAVGAAFSLFAGIGEWAANLFTSIKDGIKNYFQGKIDECGGDIVGGIFQGIIDAIAGIGSWIKEHIFDPFIRGFKRVFGINSPSKEMQTMGGYLIDGLKSGLGNIWGKVKEKFDKLKEGIVNFFKDPIGTIKVAVDKGVEKAKGVWDGFKNSTVVKTLTENGGSKITSFFKNTWEKLTSGSAKKTLDSGWKDTASSNNATKFNDIKSGTVKKDMEAKLSRFDDAIPKKDKWLYLEGWINKLEQASAIKDKKWLYLEGWINKLYQSGKIDEDKWLYLTGYIDELKKTAKAKLDFKGTLKTGKSNEVTMQLAKGGGIASGNKFKGLSQFASGGIPDHGSLILAGEHGPEVAGHINGRTEILNRSQIASTIASGVGRMLTRFNPAPQLAFVQRQVASQQTANTQMSQELGTIAKLLTAVLVAVKENNTDVYFDTAKVTNEIVKQINKDIRATGVSPILI